MKKSLSLIAAFAFLAPALATLHAGPRPGFGELFYEGEIVRTVVPPAAMKKPGTDDFYAVMGGADEQRGVIAVAPGDQDYRGGKWAFHAVVWNVSPYLLTSEDEVLLAAAIGDVTITRVEANDFKCPVQP